MGVRPRRPHVRRTVGSIRKPVSSRKTSCALKREVFWDARPLPPHPTGHRLLVLLKGPLLGLLAREAQGPQEPGQGLNVTAHAVAAADELGDPAASPQVGSEAVCAGALQQAVPQVLFLGIGELAGAARRRLGAQGGLATLPIGFPPLPHAEWCDTESTSHLRLGVTLLQQADRTMSPGFQFLCTSTRSHSLNCRQLSTPLSKYGSSPNQLVTLGSKACLTFRMK